MSTKLEFIRIDPSSTAKVVSLTVGILLAIVLLIAFAAAGLQALFSNTLSLVAGINWVVITIVPFMYLIVVYAVVFTFCLVFNYACRLFGGIRIEFSDN